MGSAQTDFRMMLPKTYHCLRCRLNLPRLDSHSCSIPQLGNVYQIENLV
jgi:hypothetical protein